MTLEELEQLNKDDYVLDVGCWGGKRVLELSEISKNVYGIDINTKRFDKRLKNRLFFGNVVKGIPLDMKFDWILLFDVLEHVSDDSRTLRNINKSLKKTGKLILTTTRSLKYFEFYDPAWVRWKFGGNRHYHYTKKELFTKLKETGFEIEEHYLKGNLAWIIARWINVFLKYGLRIKKQLEAKQDKGFCIWVIRAKKQNGDKR